MIGRHWRGHSDVIVPTNERSSLHCCNILEPSAEYNHVVLAIIEYPDRNMITFGLIEVAALTRSCPESPPRLDKAEWLWQE